MSIYVSHPGGEGLLAFFIMTALTGGVHSVGIKPQGRRSSLKVECILIGWLIRLMMLKAAIWPLVPILLGEVAAPTLI